MKFKTYQLFVLLFILPTNVKSQDHIFEWAKQFEIYNNSGFSEGHAITTDNQGNVYTSGIFEQTVDFNPSPDIAYYLGASTNPGQVFFQKMDAEGNFIWAKKLDYLSFCTVKKIATDSNNNLYIVGEFSGTGDFNPGLGTDNMTSNGLHDIFILKLDQNGNYIWSKQIGGLYDDHIESITIDSQGDIYTTGGFKGIVNFAAGTSAFILTSNGDFDAFIQKFNSDGSFAWVKSFGGNSDDYGYDVAVDSQGNIYSTGYFKDIVDFDTDSSIYNLTANGITTDIFVHKLSPNGDFLWAKQMEGTSNEKSSSIAVDTQSNVYLTGIFGGPFGATVDFDPDINNVQNFTVTSGTIDVFVQKLNTNGDLIWIKQIQCTSVSDATSMVLDDAGNSYLLGIFNGNITLNSSGSPTVLVSSGDEDIFIQKLNTNGDFVWGKRIGDYQSDRGNSLTIGIDETLYTTGFFEHEVDFDPGSNDYYLDGDQDCFILKLRALKQNDLGVSSMQLSCDTNIIFRIQNYGYNTVDSFEVGWSIDNIVQQPIMSYQTISTSDSSYIIATNIFFDTGQIYEVDAWINSVNDSADGLVFNDSTNANLSSPFSVEIVDTVIWDVHDWAYGEIHITPSGDTSLYQYLWSNGATTQDVTNLQTSGYYYLTITDFAGCQDTFSFNLLYVNTNFVHNNQVINLNLFPNPVSKNRLINIEFDVTLPNDLDYQLININGKILSNGQLLSNELQYQINAPEQSGMYYLQLLSKNRLLKVIPFVVR
jgi:hypothetical protein